MMNDILEKAKKLLALRDRAGTRGEAEAAARALAKMLDKHRITMAQLHTQGDGGAESAIADEKTPLIVWRRAVTWRRSLIETLCKHYGVAHWSAKRLVGFTRDGRKKYSKAVHLCGRPSDVALVRHLFAWLTVELTRIGSAECAGHGTAFKNSWMLGFAEGIDEQLNQAREEVMQDMGDAAMVLQSRADEANRALEEQVQGLCTIGYTMSYRPEAYAAGQRRGAAHHLGEKLDTGNARALPEAVAP